jgi:hypothetical protein
VDIDVDRARWRGTLNFRVLHTLQIGVEVNPGVEEIGPLVTWFLLTETERRPAAFLGTSSDRIGTPEGNQSYYLTLAKYVPQLRSGPYVSLNWSDYDDAFNIPFGVNVELGRGFSVRPMYDGQRTHLMASWTNGRIGVSALYVWLENPGVSVSVGF